MIYVKHQIACTVIITDNCLCHHGFRREPQWQQCKNDIYIDTHTSVDTCMNCGWEPSSLHLSRASMTTTQGGKEFPIIQRGSTISSLSWYDKSELHISQFDLSTVVTWSLNGRNNCPILWWRWILDYCSPHCHMNRKSWLLKCHAPCRC